MCQCVLCDCWWCNLCGEFCAGAAINFFVLGCWVLKPEDMKNPACCSACTWTGLGDNLFCWGGICCAPDYVKDWSRAKGGKSNIGDALDSGK
jgi:hypothetical protein